MVFSTTEKTNNSEFVDNALSTNKKNNHNYQSSTRGQGSEEAKKEESSLDSIGNRLDDNDDYLEFHDISVKAGHRLYTQAIERLRRHEAKRTDASDDSRQSSPDDRDDVEEKNRDVSVKAGNRLYSQALERRKRHEARLLESSSDSKGSSQDETKKDDSSDDQNERQDLSTRAGNRLYTQAIERLKRHEARRAGGLDDSSDKLSGQEVREHNEFSESLDLSVKAGNRLYTQAIERLRRHEARRSSGSDDGSGKQSCQDERDDFLYSEGDLSVKAGNRLYIQALDQYRRQEEMRTQASKPVMPKLELATQKGSNQRLLSKGSQSSYDSNSSPYERCDHLYHLSATMQQRGKQRRAFIEEEKAKAKMRPETKILPSSQASDMYIRGMEQIIAHRLKIAEKAAKLERNNFC